MRKVVVFVLLGALALAGLCVPTPFTPQTTHAQAAAPTIRRLGPDTVPAGSSGFTLRVEGRNFVDGAQILFDGAPLAKPRLSGKKGRVVLAELPASAIATVGTHTVAVQNPDGMTTAPSTLTVVAQDAELRMQLGGNATEEDPGSDLEFDVIGEGFTENSTAIIWGAEAVKTTFVNDTRVVVQIAENIMNEPATIPIHIRNRGGRLSNAENFFIVSRPARISFFEPERIDVGAEDTDLIVRGNFKAGAILVLNNQPLETTQDRDNVRLRAKIPAAMLANPAQLFLRVEQDGVQSSDSIITVEPETGPVIFDISPVRVIIGENKQNLDIYGANLNGQPKVMIDGEEANIRIGGRFSISVRIPPDILEVPGTHTVRIEDDEGNSSETFTFEIASDTEVKTLVGDGRDGFASGCVSAETARLRRPRRISLGPDGLLYITDQQNHAIRTINPTTGEVCTIVGTGEFGYHDSGNAAGKQPTFSFPNGVAVAADGTMFVTENGNNVVRRVRRNGGNVTVDTVAGTAEVVAATARQEKLNATLIGRDGFREGVARAAAFRKPDDIVAAPDGSFYFTDPGNSAIRRLTPSGDGFMVETFVGNGVPGFIDGAGDVARFNTPTGLAISPDGAYLYVADTNNNRIRRVHLATRQVETVAGDGSFGNVDGPSHLASLSQPLGLAFDADGILYVSEFGRNVIRRVDQQGNVTAFAGFAKVKFRDGPGLFATFNTPRGLAVANGTLYIVDSENLRIRTIALP